MKNRLLLLFISGLLLSLGGCASVTPQPPAKADLPATMPQQASEGIIVEPAPTVSGNPAIIALLDRARIDAGAGQREAAGASLERALRIEPRNAWLWHELAQVRLAEGQYAQAIALARKSTSFARHDRRLQALNWRVIGSARARQGDAAGAEQALKSASDLEK